MTMVQTESGRYLDVPDSPRMLVGEEATAVPLERVQNTLSADVQGLLSAQALGRLVEGAKLLRPIVEPGQMIDLVAGKLTYPKVVERPVTQIQPAEKQAVAGGSCRSTRSRSTRPRTSPRAI